MGTSSLIALTLDIEMIEEHAAPISPRRPGWRFLADRAGADVAAELGGRLLLRFMLPDQVGRFIAGSPATHFVSPTPYAPEETVSYLALPAPADNRFYCLFLNPARIPFIRGPQWVRGGLGIQYILPYGFPREALALPYPDDDAVWEMQVR